MQKGYNLQPTRHTIDKLCLLSMNDDGFECWMHNLLFALSDNPSTLGNTSSVVDNGYLELSRLKTHLQKWWASRTYTTM